jgi:hypothetical protein
MIFGCLPKINRVTCVQYADLQHKSHQQNENATYRTIGSRRNACRRTLAPLYTLIRSFN